MLSLFLPLCVCYIMLVVLHVNDLGCTKGFVLRGTCSVCVLKVTLCVLQRDRKRCNGFSCIIDDGVFINDAL